MSTSRTVRDQAFDVMRRLGLTTIFANPGSTEVPFLAGLPEDLRFVLALHEGSVVGMATGWALGHERPAFVNLHTVAGLGNAVSALATARQNRAPLVVVVGQQDRRHLALQPFLAGRLDDLAGSYPVWVSQPERAQDVPGAIARAYYEACGPTPGPALVIVPMDDWLSAADEEAPVTAPGELVRGTGVDTQAVQRVAGRLRQTRSPALVVGAGADDTRTRQGLTDLAERLGAPVWQEAFGARAGFPRDHPRFAGQLPAGRGKLRECLSGHDTVLVVGAPVFRQYPYEPGPLLPEGTSAILLTADQAEAHRSPADLAVHTPLPDFVAALAREVPARETPAPPARRPATGDAPGTGAALRAEHVFAALVSRLPADAVVVEESPSNRPALEASLPAREPLGFLSAAGGGLGFAMPASVGLRMALPERPVVVVVGDGSAMYQIQSLWSAARYRAGVLFIVLNNGGYAIMDRLVEGHLGASVQDDPRAGSPWPRFPEVHASALAAAFGCPAELVTDHDELIRVLDGAVPELAGRDEPLVVEVEIGLDPSASYHP